MLPAVVPPSVSGRTVHLSEDGGESWHANKVPGVITVVRLVQN